ncbi:hypothetical protein COHA_004539 [Chlorella ohadii]|uniref:VWFA domain-containing protein n=1 Tax=Chlorella ohadii TaxID=2649997 RepID=A0AAD5H723_9CHLO|nr:hypothetical protein COHA_004539 [Chlorella ohadii]
MALAEVCNAGATTGEVCCEGGTCYDDDGKSNTPEKCCPSGQKVCGSTCCDLGKVCSGTTCVDCVTNNDCTTGGKICCGNTCVDPSAKEHCGGCNPCNAKQTCSNVGGTYKCKLIPADIYFLADNTGSMGGAITAVKAGATQILNGLSINDLFTGGGRYRDRDDFLFQSTSNLAIGINGAQIAINRWSASGGGDEPESQLYALYQASRLQPSHSHNPICKNYLSTTPSVPPADITFDDVKAALQAKGIKIIALSVGNNRLDADNFKGTSPCTEVVVSNQASKLAAATGGIYKSGIDTTTIVKAIIDALKEATCPSSLNTGIAGFAAARATVTEPEVLTIGTEPAIN